MFFIGFFGYSLLLFYRLLVDGNPIRSIKRSLLTSGTQQTTNTIELKKYLRTRGPPLPDMEIVDNDVVDTMDDVADVTAGNGILEAVLEDRFRGVSR